MCGEYAKMISGLRLLPWQLASHGNSLNCHGKVMEELWKSHGKVMELYYQISVEYANKNNVSVRSTRSLYFLEHIFSTISF